MRLPASRGRRAVVRLCLASLAIAGCRTAEDVGADSSGLPRSADARARAAGDTLARTPAKDADHEFLRKMADHHQALIEMAGPSATKAVSRQAQADVRRVHDRQLAERDSTLAMIRTMYGEAHGPEPMSHHVAMNDTLQSLAGVDHDRTFYRMAIAHHREGIALLDAYRPRLTKPEVQALAERMRGDLQRELAEFEQKLPACCT